MTQVIHTPYDGSSKPFSIGLKPLDLVDWIDVDAHLPRYLDEKQRLTTHQFEDIVVSETGSEAAQHEVLTLLCTYLCSTYPDHYRRHGTTIKIIAADRAIEMTETTIPAIHRAASLVQEDLVIMSRDETGWRLVAASVCFPSTWNLLEKFGKPMQEIHAPIPGFGPGTRNAHLIERMFDNLRVEHPVVRWNWSLYGDDKLHHPRSNSQDMMRFGQNAEPENIHLRLERQTLRKLPVSQALLFTIRIYIDPLKILSEHRDGTALSNSIAEQLNALSVAEIAYKGLTNERKRLLAHLNR